MNRMFKHLLAPGLVLPALLVGGCDSPEPVSPASSEQPVFARAEATPVTVYFSTNPTALGEWTYTDGMLHIRDLMTGGPLSGYLEGTVTGSCDTDLHLATGAGPARCSGTMEVTHIDGQAVTGTMEVEMRGRASGYLTPAFVHSGHLVGHGTGDMAGMKIRGTYTNEANPGVSTYVLTGSILDPHGG